MKQLLLSLSLFTALFATSTYANSPMPGYFQADASIPSTELIDMTDLFGHHSSLLTSDQIAGGSATTVQGFHSEKGYIQLPGDNKAFIDHAPLSRNEPTILQIHPDQRARYLRFDSDANLFGITSVAGLLPDLPTPPGFKDKRKAKDKGIAIRKPEVKIGEFTKIGYGSDIKRFPFRNNGFTQINFKVRIQEQYGVIVNAISVLANGQSVSWKTVGKRLTDGDNMFPLTIPENATDIQVSFNHGQGSQVQVYLQR